MFKSASGRGFSGSLTGSSTTGSCSSITGSLTFGFSSTFGSSLTSSLGSLTSGSSNSRISGPKPAPGTKAVPVSVPSDGGEVVKPVLEGKNKLGFVPFLWFYNLKSNQQGIGFKRDCQNRYIFGQECQPNRRSDQLCCLSYDDEAKARCRSKKIRNSTR